MQEVTGLINDYGIWIALSIWLIVTKWSDIKNSISYLVKGKMEDTKKSKEHDQDMAEINYEFKVQTATAELSRRWAADEKAYKIIEHLLEEDLDVKKDITRALQEILVAITKLDNALVVIAKNQGILKESLRALWMEQSKKDES